MVRSIILVLFLLNLVLSGCKVPETETRESEKTVGHPGPAPGSEGGFGFGREVRWGKHVLPVERPEGSLGGIDFIQDSSESIHAVVTIKYMDVWAGGYRYALYYFHNENGYWTRHTLKLSQNRFYKVSGGYGETNFVRIILDEEENPIIFSIDTNDNLLSYYKGREEVLASDVGSFAVVYDDYHHVIKMAYMDEYWNANSITVESRRKDLSLLSQQRFSGFSGGSEQSQIQILLHNTNPTVLFKAYNSQLRTGQFFMIYGGEMYVLGNGVNSHGVFNAYLHNGKLKTCMKNVVHERKELTIDLYSKSGTYRTAGYQRNSTSPQQCFISEDHHYPFVRYNNYGGWNSYFEFWNWNYREEGRTGRLPVSELRNLKWYNGKIWVGGIDSNTNSPIILVKN